MSKKDNLKFKKTFNNNRLKTPKNQRDYLKTKIVRKFGASPEEADKILYEIEKKALLEENFKNNSPNTPKDNFDNKNNSKPISRGGGGDNILNGKKMENINSKYNTKPLPELKSDVYINQKQKNDDVNLKSKNNNQTLHNVDSILEEVIPNYNQPLSVKLSHVDLIFEVQNEKTDTLKEAFIRTIKRNKSKKFIIPALKDVSFQIYKGEKVGIIGYNGAGKSTLLNLISGIYPPNNGSVEVYGNISPLLSLGAGFDPNSSGRQNIFLNGAVLGYDKNYLRSKLDEIIEFSELGNFIDIPIKNYSAGMLAKLGFSIATSVNPDILIIDEILGVGDVNFQKKSADKIRSLMDGGTTVILVSHSIPQIRELCDKAIWIDEGKLREMGEVNKVCDHYLNDAERASKEQLANIQFR